jgi:putative transcriptional regulator
MIKVKLRELIWEYDTTAKHIAEVTGLNASNISEIVRGKHTNLELDTINKLCKYFNCKISDILEYIPD